MITENSVFKPTSLTLPEQEFEDNNTTRFLVTQTSGEVGLVSSTGLQSAKKQLVRVAVLFGVFFGALFLLNTLAQTHAGAAAVASNWAVSMGERNVPVRVEYQTQEVASGATSHPSSKVPGVETSSSRA